MATKVLHIDRSGGVADAVRRGVEAIDRGALVAFPTETVYGLGVRVDIDDAVSRLREVKSRQDAKAFTLHIAAPEEAEQFVPDIPPVARRLMNKAWPGPLTLILPVSDPEEALRRAGFEATWAKNLYFENTIGLRCPDDPIASALLGGAGGPVVASSANQAGNPPPWSGQDVLRDLDGRIDLLIDAGETRYGKPSTIVRVREGGYDILREGVYDARIVERMAALRILFVCTGNTCRSVMAEALARKLLAERLGCPADELAARGVYVRSAGVAGGFGGATDHARTVMGERGLDVSDHVSTALTPDIIRESDHIFAMTAAHRDRIIEMAPTAARRTQLLLGDRDVHDPIGGSVDEYRDCARTIEEGLRTCLARIAL